VTAETPTPPTPDAALPVGARVGSFVIDAVLSRGEFGFVYRATDVLLVREVALKEYFPRAWFRRGDDAASVLPDEAQAAQIAGGRQAFIEEARLLARLAIPGLLRVTGLFEAFGTVYRVMPFHAGLTLADARERDTPDAAGLRRLLHGLLDPLEALHGVNLVHGYLHPEQVLLADGDRPMLLGFGTVRRALHGALDPAYAPVEQMPSGGQVPRGAWTDLYALSAVAAFVIAGRAPPVGEQAAQQVFASAADSLGPVLAATLQRALATQTAQRPQTVAAFRAGLALESPASGPSSVFGVDIELPLSPPAEAPRPPPRPPRAKPAPAATPIVLPLRAAVLPAVPAPPEDSLPTIVPAALEALAKTASMAQATPRIDPPPPRIDPAPLRIDPPPPRIDPPPPRIDPPPLRIDPPPLRIDLPPRADLPPTAPYPAAPVRIDPPPRAEPAMAGGHEGEEEEPDPAVRAAIAAVIGSLPPAPPRITVHPQNAEAGVWHAARREPERPAEVDDEQEPAETPTPSVRQRLLRFWPWAAGAVVVLLLALAAWYGSRPEVGSDWQQRPRPADPATPERRPTPSLSIGPDESTPAARAAASGAQGSSLPQELQSLPAPSAGRGSSSVSIAEAPAARDQRSADERETILPPRAAARAPAQPAPRDACSGRSNFSFLYCMQTQCRKPQFSDHAQCRELRATGEIE
jgi:serine/threonine protein kinase